MSVRDRRTATLIAAAPAAPAYVYLLRCRDGSLYCGWTDDLAARLATHRRGKGSAYVRSRLPVELVWCEGCADRSAAMRREYAIKRLTRAEKLRLARAPSRRNRSLSPGGPGRSSSPL